MGTITIEWNRIIREVDNYALLIERLGPTTESAQAGKNAATKAYSAMWRYYLRQGAPYEETYEGMERYYDERFRETPAEWAAWYQLKEKFREFPAEDRPEP